MKGEGLHTVCQEAGCPNIYECWEDREATFLIGGEQCTRRCDFCQIDTGKPEPLDRDEPRRVAESVATMGLRQFRRHRSLQSPKQPRLALRIKADKSRLFIPPAEMFAGNSAAGKPVSGRRIICVMFSAASTIRTPAVAFRIPCV